MILRVYFEWELSSGAMERGIGDRVEILDLREAERHLAALWNDQDVFIADVLRGPRSRGPFALYIRDSSRQMWVRGRSPGFVVR